jgi:hypothetical protein
MELPYDGDTNDASQYCKHGTFIGSWWGPDYLCQACEDGEPAPGEERMDDWRTAVANGDTVFGLADWTAHQEAAEDARDMELEQRILASEREAECDRLNRLR